MEAKHAAEKEEMKQKLQRQMQTDTNVIELCLF